MKAPSKFANLGRSGLARRIAPKEAPPVKARKATEPFPQLEPGKLEPYSGNTSLGAFEENFKKENAPFADRVNRWRKANPELYLERQRAYAKKHRAKKRKEKAK